MESIITTLLHLLTNCIFCACVDEFRFCAILRDQSELRSSLRLLLWRQTVSSKIQCAIRCHGDPRCCSFQYNRVRKQCQGHSKELAAEPGFQTYSVCDKSETAQSSCPESSTLSLMTPTVKNEHGTSELDPRGKTIPNTFREKDLLHFSITTLHEACEKGLLNAVKFMISKRRADINSRNRKGMTPVMAAVKAGHVAVFNFLRSQGCDLKAVDKYKNNVLIYACIGGNVHIVTTLVVHVKLNVDRRGQNGVTPVMKAAYHGHIDVVDFLLEKGCDSEAVTPKGFNILHAACLGGHEGMVKYILEKDVVSKESRDNQCRTPVILAAKNDHTQIVDLLVNENCNVKAVDIYHDNMLHVACVFGRENMVKHILTRGLVNKESKGWSGQTPLLRAAAEGKLEVIKVLKRRGCKTNVVDMYKNNILIVACTKVHLLALKYILSETKISIDSRGQYGWTPVFVASKMGHESVVDLLLRNGCSLTLRDIDKNTVLHVACINGNTALVDNLLAHGAGNIIEKKGRLGRTPVFFAAQYGHKNVVELLVSKGCRMSAADDLKRTVLHVACAVGDEDIIRYTLSQNVDINSRDVYGKTPIMTAAITGRTRVIEILLEQGCDRHVVDSMGNTVLHCACLAGREDTALYLARLGYWNKAKNDKGMTPKRLAESMGLKAVAAFFGTDRFWKG